MSFRLPYSTTLRARFVRLLLVGWMGGLWWLGSGPLWAASANPVVTVHSHSEQFIVSGPAQTPSLEPPEPAAATIRSVHLSPPLLAVICERIKQELLLLLEQPDQWQNRIYLAIRPAKPTNEPVVVAADYTEVGWLYRLELPGSMDTDLLIRVVTEVLLQEMSNRRAGSQPGELPPWLIAGLVAGLQSEASPGLVVQDRTRTLRVERKGDPLKKVHERLILQAPLLVDELNWPTEDQWNSPPDGLYPACAQLFVTQLLRLRNGPACMQAMLAQLPEHLNWQTAFLRAFAPHFHNLRDVEKWWSLILVTFTGRDPAKTWTLDESWQKLEEVLHSAVRVRLATNTLPARAEATLQTIISQWSYPRQKPLLQQKTAQLQFLRQRICPHLLTLTEDYRQTLATYLQRRARAGFAPELKGQPMDSLKLIVLETVEKLDLLDEVRADLKQFGHVPAVSPSVPPPGPAVP